MDYKIDNNLDREYFSQNFSVMQELLTKIRNSLATGDTLDTSSLKLDGVIALSRDNIIFVKLFQCGQKHIRFGSIRNSLDAALNRCIEKLRENKNFSYFDVSNPDKCRIMLEFVTERIPVKLQEIQERAFNESRFEPGITGVELKTPSGPQYYLPTDAIIESHISLRQALAYLAKRTDIKNLTNKISERLEELKKREEYEYFLFKTRAFVTYKNECMPLYRGNVLYNEFSYDTLISQFEKSCQWLIDHMLPDGRFLYYYDCTNDNQIDHEHPGRPSNDLYYNDLRHSGGTITLLRAYTHTKNPAYLVSAKRSLDWTVSILKKHKTKWGEAFCAYYNEKAKLGGIGVPLVAFMHYRNITKDKSYDRYIKGCTRHLLSRIIPSGEFLGYYINPSYNNGKPLLTMSDRERQETFSFYYPGEALLGLALFANYFDTDKRLVKETRRMSRIALDWLIDERPKSYAHHFTILPSDAWLMQAIEEWANDPEFREKNWLDFVYTDAQTMLDKMYQKDDSPYIDYEGGYYYNYGDHYYPDGARSEGLIAAYYLAEKMDEKELAEKILKGCKLAAKCQFHLYNCEKSNYAHLNPEFSKNTIRFKATRQWIRVDSFQHVDCFFIRLFWVENQSS